LFLALNGFQLNAIDANRVLTMLAVASNELNEADLAALLND
jgi:prophage maintenance system killer protein